MSFIDDVLKELIECGNTNRQTRVYFVKCPDGEFHGATGLADKKIAENIALHCSGEVMTVDVNLTYDLIK